MRHLLVTNDFPPKVGGIQTYLWELWRRLPPDDVVVLTTPHPDAAAFDAAQAFRIERIREPVMVPTPVLARQIRRLARSCGAAFIVLDPSIPLGLVASQLDLPYAVVMHGSESTGRVPGGSRAMGSVLAGAKRVIAAGGFPAAETRRVTEGRTPPITVVPPGIDLARFAPLAGDARAEARRRLGLPADSPVVVGVSRLVPRKGFDRTIEAVADLAPSFPGLTLAVGGSGRDRPRLEALIERTQSPARLLGRVADGDLPLLYASADLFVMPCRTRWFGVEPEGFGIVFLEASASGTPPIAGNSGGAPDAVVDGVTGLVVDDPSDRRAVAAAMASLLEDEHLRTAMADAGRRRVTEEFGYDTLAATLAAALQEVV